MAPTFMAVLSIREAKREMRADIPNKFLHKCIDVRQLRPVGKVRDPVGAYDTVDFLLRSKLDIGVDGHC